MTTETSGTGEARDPAPPDAADTGTGPAPFDGRTEAEDETDSDKDPMGIDDDDPIDATLVGKPTEDAEGRHDTPSSSDKGGGS